MPELERPLQQRAVATRDAIIQAAARIFNEQGYAATGVDQIIRTAGITKGGLYFHFRSKAAIAEALVTQVETTWAAIRDDVDAATLEHGWSHLEQLHQVARAVASVRCRSVETSAAIRLSDEWSAIPTELPVPLRTWSVYTLTKLHHAESAQETRPGLDLDAAARVIVSGIYGIDRIVRRPGQDPNAFLDRIEEWWQLLLPGLSR